MPDSTDTSDSPAGTETGSPADGTTVEWRLFADLAEAATRATTVELAAAATARDALDALVAAHPELVDAALADGDLAEHVTLLQNGSRVDDLGEPVADGDELALMPPVSGG